MEARDGTADLTARGIEHMTSLADTTCMLGAVEKGRLGQGFLSGTSLYCLFRRLHTGQPGKTVRHRRAFAWLDGSQGGFRAAGCMPEAVQAAASNGRRVGGCQQPTAKVAESCMHARACSRPSLLAKKQAVLGTDACRVYNILAAPVQQGSRADRTLETGVACSDWAASISVCCSHQNTANCIHQHSA